MEEAITKVNSASDSDNMFEYKAEQRSGGHNTCGEAAVSE